jgi:hypothetical protein
VRVYPLSHRQESKRCGFLRQNVRTWRVYRHKTPQQRKSSGHRNLPESKQECSGRLCGDSPCPGRLTYGPVRKWMGLPSIPGTFPLTVRGVITITFIGPDYSSGLVLQPSQTNPFPIRRGWARNVAKSKPRGHFPLI